jgi:DNA polymerase-3 subunit delta'
MASGATVEGSAPAPRANPDLFGHEATEEALSRLGRSGRLPHALLFGGPRGIGKATLAFRLARFLLAGNAVEAGRGLATNPDSPVSRRVAAGGHADLLTVERALDAQRHRLRGDITADQTREIAGFLHLTAGEGGWRIVIVDEAETMNRNAANALLKILEEPPRGTLLLLVSHRPGALLPTIRSRCRRLRLEALASPVVTMLLGRYRPQLEPTEAAMAAALSRGSIGRALELADAGGLALYRSFAEILSDLPRLDMQRLHAFVDGCAGAGAETAYRMVGELLLQSVARIAVLAADRGCSSTEQAAHMGETLRRLAASGTAASWADLRQTIGDDLTAADDLNLDRKQTLLGAFFAMAEMTR